VENFSSTELGRVMGGAPSRAEEVKIVHEGKHIDEYFGPAVSVAEIMLSSSHGGTPEVCRCPSTVWAPEVALMRGNRFFFIVPFYTFFHLVRRQSCNGMSTTSTTPCIVRRSNSGSASSEPRQSADSSFSGEHEKVVASTTTIASLDAPASCHTVLYKSPMRMQIVNETSSKIRPALREHQHRRSSDHKETVVVREKVMQPKSSSKWHQEGFRLNLAMETHNTTHRIPKNSLNRVLHKLSDDERERSSAIDKGRNTESLRERSIEDAVRGSAGKTGIEDAAVGAAASQRRLKLADHLDDERRDVLRGLQEHQNTHHGRSDKEEMRRRRCTAAGGMVVPSSCNVEAGASAKLSPPPAGQRLSALCVARFTKVARCERNAYVVPRNTLKHEERNPSSLAMVMRSDSRIKNSTGSTVTTASGSSRGHPIKIAYNNVFEKGRVADKERDHETSTRVERLKLATRSADWISCTWSCNDATRRSSSQVRRRGLHLSPYLVEEAVKDRKRALQLQLQENGKILDRRKSAEMQVNRRTKDDWNTESTAEDVAVENSTWQSKKHEYIVEFEGDDMRSEVAYNEENLDSRSLPDVHLFQHLHQLYTGSISISDILSSDQLARINEVAKAPGRSSSSSSSSHKLRHTSDPIVEKHKELDRKRTSILLKMLQTGKAQLGTSEAMKTYNNLKRVSKRREQAAARDSSMTQSKLPSSSSSSETLSRRPKLAEYFNTSTSIMQTSRDHHYTIARKNNLALSHTCAKSVLESQDNAPSRITSTFTDHHNLMGEEFDLPIMNNQSFKTSTLTEDNLSSFEHSLAFPSLFVPDATMLRYRRRSSRRSRRHRGQWQPHLATLNECSP
jgi:hypothetical protein